jgi:hypothetical protein
MEFQAGANGKSNFLVRQKTIALKKNKESPAKINAEATAAVTGA